MRHASIAAVFLVACSAAPTVPPTPSTLQIVSGNGQTGAPGYLLADSIVVRLMNDAGGPVVGDTIFFTLADTTGVLGPWIYNSPKSFSSALVVTDSQGLAHVAWRLGGTLGPQQLDIHTAEPGVGDMTVVDTARSGLATSIGGNYSVMCATDTTGHLACWAPPRKDGSFVSFTFTPVASPVQFREVVVVTQGTPQPEGCAIATTGRVWCFTLGAHDSVTNLAELAGDYPALTVLAGASNDIAASYCGLTADGQAWCWGANDRGQLGDGTETTRAMPAPVTTGARFVQIDVGGRHVCAVTSGGDVWCWGNNTSAESGQSTATAMVMTPAQLTTPLHFSRVFAASDQGDNGLAVSCGIVASDGLYCWGDLSSLSTVDQSAAVDPTAIPGGTFIVDVAENTHQTFALSSTATLLETERLRSPLIWSPPQAIRDFVSRHIEGFVCGTATDGSGTLCVQGPIPELGPFNVPDVIGVPLP